MERTMLDILYQLMKKDVATYEHCIRVGKMAKMMALHLNYNQEQTHNMVAGCLMHDIGKILVPDGILKKVSSLTMTEWETTRCHPVFGANMALKERIENQSVIETIKYLMNDGTEQATPMVYEVSVFQLLRGSVPLLIHLTAWCMIVIIGKGYLLKKLKMNFGPSAENNLTKTWFRSSLNMLSLRMSVQTEVISNESYVYQPIPSFYKLYF